MGCRGIKNGNAVYFLRSIDQDDLSADITVRDRNVEALVQSSIWIIFICHFRGCSRQIVSPNGPSSSTGPSLPDARGAGTACRMHARVDGSRQDKLAKLARCFFEDVSPWDALNPNPALRRRFLAFSYSDSWSSSAHANSEHSMSN